MQTFFKLQGFSIESQIKPRGKNIHDIFSMDDLESDISALEYNELFWTTMIYIVSWITLYLRIMLIYLLTI